jgi:S-adenosylmethionine:tRNA ribosyltransferase-isomerase
MIGSVGASSQGDALPSVQAILPGVTTESRDPVKIEDYSFGLPQDLIARIPVTPRDTARLLVCSLSEPERTDHRRIRDLPDLLRAGDLLIVNETKVLPHRLLGTRESGGKVECLILEREGRKARGFLKPSGRLKPGEVLSMEDGALELEIREQQEGGRHLFELRTPDGQDPDLVLERVGRAPLPPYLTRGEAEEDPAWIRERYQCVFAKEPGAVAAPTAGLHLTEELIETLQAGGVEMASVVLHVGEGTFEPLRVSDIEDHVMHEEEYILPQETVAAVEACKARGGRVLCVGTTSARVLESCVDEEGRLQAGAGRTRLFLYPGKGPRILDGLLTNFHLPQSSLLLLVASMLGRERLLALYEQAIAEGYRFYSFGDAMLILP